MGGLADGGRCAEIAISAFISGLISERGQKLSDMARLAALSANSEVYRQYRERGGTTLVAIVSSAHAGAMASVGDSRIYAISHSKKLEQITVDDTVEGALRKVVGVNESDANWESFAGQLTQFVGMGDALQPRIYPLRSNSSYLLTSDGVHNIIGTNFKSITLNAGLPFNMVTRLLQVAKWCGGTDNASAVVMPPIKPDWMVPPNWSTGEWLEIWDSSGKIDIDLNRASAALASQRVAVPQPPNIEVSKDSRPRKRQSGTPKRRNTKTSPANSGLQGALEIEIVDQGQSFKQNTSQAGSSQGQDSSESQPSKVESPPQDDKTKES
jgi:serine/threonine protein phosphatase PrpC